MIEFDQVIFSRHAVQKMFSRQINRESVIDVLRRGTIIEEYANDQPFPSRLLMGQVENQPLHVVAAYDVSNRTCVVITTYVPDPQFWESDWMTRRSK